MYHTDSILLCRFTHTHVHAVIRPVIPVTSIHIHKLYKEHRHQCSTVQSENPTSWPHVHSDVHTIFNWHTKHKILPHKYQKNDRKCYTVGEKRECRCCRLCVWTYYSLFVSGAVAYRVNWIVQLKRSLAQQVDWNMWLWHWNILTLTYKNMYQ